MPRLQPGKVGYFSLVLAFCLAWSSAFAIGKIALEVSPPSLFLALRFLAAGALLLIWAYVRGELSAARPIPWLGLFGLGLLNQAGYNGLTWLGMTTSVSSGLAAVIISTNPILVAALAPRILGERITAQRLAGLVLGLLGVVIVVRGRIVVTGEDVDGIALVTGGLLSLAAGTILFKRWSPSVPLPLIVGVQSLSAGFALLAVGVITESPAAIVLGAKFWFALAYNVVIVSIGAFVLWFLLLSHGSATSASALHLLMPPLGLGFGWAVLGEPVPTLDLLGVVPIALGIRLATHGHRTESAPTTTPRPDRPRRWREAASDGPVTSPGRDGPREGRR